MGFHTMVFPSSFWKLLEGSMYKSNLPSISKPETATSQKSFRQRLSFWSERKQSAHPCRIFRKPFVAQTATAASFLCPYTTRTLSSLPRKPRTSHFLPPGNSTTFFVPMHRAVLRFLVFLGARISKNRCRSRGIFCPAIPTPLRLLVVEASTGRPRLGGAVLVFLVTARIVREFSSFA